MATVGFQPTRFSGVPRELPLAPLPLVWRTCAITARCFIGGMGALLSSEEEPEMFDEFGRLSEMQRRNTQCLPHMKTSYPVETQATSPEAMDEMRIKRGTPLEKQLLQVPQPRVPLAHSTKTIALDDAHSILRPPRRGLKRSTTASPDEHAVAGANTVAAASSNITPPEEVRKVS